MRIKNLIPTAILALFVTGVGLMAQNLSTLDIPLETPDGDQTSIAEIGADKVTIVSFGATWCVPCKKEMKAINEIYSELQDKGVEYIAVFIDNTKTMAKVGPYVKGKKFKFPVLLDPNSEVFETVNGTEVPYALIYDQNGELQFKHDGYLDGDEEHIKEEAFSLTESPENGSEAESGM
ncbi:MAG: TlpA family protein disulfide reductase [Chlorobi bacterium]|nr:TlpA family protein disulfide reductase [Chlorobiota bacterium]